MFSIPGPIYSSHSKGTNQLIQQGKRPLLEPSELLDYLNLEQFIEYRAARKVIPIDPLEAEILQLIEDEALNLDDICVLSGQSVEQISSVLSTMELKGMLRRDVGMWYLAIHEQVQEYSIV